MTTSIPGVNYTIRQALDRLQYQALVYNDEFVQRLLLTIGHPDYFTSSAYGIVSEVDPQTAVSGSTAVPLTVAVNTTDNTSVDIGPGMAVARSGMWMVLSDYVRQIPLTDPSVGVANVIYMRYVLDPAELQINDYYDAVIPVTYRPGSPNSVLGDAAYIDVDTVDAYLQYDQNVLDDIVPIAVATLQSVQDPITLLVTTQLSIDNTRGSYAFNRPWFSAVDAVHRAQVGTGVVSATNPHGISQNDLTVGDFTPLQLQLDHGMIVADDRSIPKVPGSRCEVAIPQTSILIDATGNKTSIVNAEYVELQNYPIRLGRVWIDNGTIAPDWPAEIVKGTNRVVFPIGGVPTSYTVHMYYTKVDACEPPTGNNEIIFSTNNPSAEELIIAGGSGFTVLTNTQEAFSDAQQFPMLYDMLVDGEGEIVKTPQVIYCFKRLESISTSDTFDISLYGPARIMCGLADASGAPTMAVKVHLYGKNADGDSIEHIFDFDSSWVDPGPVPNTSLTPQAIQFSTEVFYSLDQIIIDERTDDGPNSAIMLWAALNTYDTYDLLKDSCHIAQLMWDGLRMSEIRDKRIISTTVRDFLLSSPGNESFRYTAKALAGGNSTVYVEDFRTPRYGDQVQNTERSTTLPSVLPANNLSKLGVGATGYYQTRALAVNTPTNYWRVILTPLHETCVDIYYIYQNPPLIFGFHPLVGWSSAPMSAVAGLENTYEVTLSIDAYAVMVAVDCVDYLGMVVFG